MKEVDIISKIVGRDTSGRAATFIPGAGAPSVNLDDYLLKKIWDSVFEVRTDSEGNPYLFEKMPLVTQYGITMYADDGELDLPSIYAGLPIDNQTLYWENGVLKAKGGTEGAITSITSTMVVDALGYIPANGSDVTALQNKVNDFLSGSDTDAIINKWKELESFLSGLSESDNLATILGNKANKATTLEGYGITDAYTKTKVDEMLGNYVTIATAQTITGEKNFTGGLKVNGSPIVYDTTNRYWKLEGDLLVTGGITMYASDNGFKPSTVMDAIAVDGTTISKANGYLEVIGGTGGGLTEVHWDDVIGRPTLLSSFTDDVVAGKYLPLSGGNLSGDIRLNEGVYIRDENSFNYAILGKGNTDTFLVGAPIYHTIIRGTDINIGSKTLIEWDNASILTLKRTNTKGGAFVSYKPMNQDNYGWLVGPNTDNDFTFHYYQDAGVTNELKAMVTPQGNIYTIGSLVVGSVVKSDQVVAMNVFGKGWFMNGVKLYGGGEAMYNTNGITFSSSVGGSITGRISADRVGRIGIYPTYSFIVRPGYDNTNLVRGLSVDQKGSTELICIEQSPYNLHLRQNTANLGAYIRYSSNSQYYNTWFGGVDQEYNFKLNYSTDNMSNFVNNLTLSTLGELYTRAGFNAPANTDGTVGYRQGGVMILRFNGSETLLNGINGVYIRPSGTSSKQTIFPTTGGIRISEAPLADTNKPSIAFPFSSFISFGGFHALRGESQAVVLCAPTDTTGTVILRPNGNSNSKYQFSINGLGEAVLSSESAASLTINRMAVGGAYTRYNAANQTTYGWISGSSTNHTYQCQYYNGQAYYVKLEVDQYGNLVIQGLLTSVGANISGTLTVKGAATFKDSLRLQPDGAYYGSHLYFGDGSYCYIAESTDDAMTIYASKGVTINTDLLVSGGITMYSDIRKKTKLADVELTLKQIAEAPLIKHYYNNDVTRITHVGSIAQYWAKMNDWFCSEDSDGYYTMEVQNAALASAISIARELMKYESETDKKIRLLEREVKILKEEIRILKTV